MTSGGSLSAVSVVVILACVALLAVASAVVLAPFERLTRRHAVAFMAWLAAVWVFAVLAIALIRRTV